MRRSFTLIPKPDVTTHPVGVGLAWWFGIRKCRRCSIAVSASGVGSRVIVTARGGGTAAVY